MPKVLMVCTVPTEKSGIPIVAFNLMEALVKNTSSDELQLGYVSINQPQNFFLNKLKKWDIRNYVIPRKISNPIRYIYRLAKVAKNYDVMHVHGNSATLVLEMLAAKLAGVKLRIAHSHNTTCTAKTIDKLARPLFYYLCNGRMACGKEAGKWLFRNRDFQVINNGIDSEKFRFNQNLRNRIRKDLNINNEIVIGHIGNFNYQKNHEYLLKIFTIFQKINPTSKLLLLGDGPLRNEIEKEVSSLDLTNNVIFAGSVNNPQDYMNVMDMIIMPSRFEGLPLTLIEEQANGLPVLVADTITEDSNLTGDITFLSLNSTYVKWAQTAKEIIDTHKRTDSNSSRNIKLIRSAGYDINTVAQNLMSSYRTVENI